MNIKVLEGTYSPWGKQKLGWQAEVTLGYVFLSLSAFHSLIIFILSLLSPALPPTSIRNGEGKSYLFVFAVLAPEELLEHPQPDTDCTIMNFRPSSFIYIYGELYYTRH